MDNRISSLSNVVLLVDDNHTHQYSLGRHLNESGFQVLHAHTGAETLALALRELPNIVLMDINLPDMSGFEVCRVLRTDAKTQDIPVVFHSATHDTGDARTRAYELGAVSFLSYPIDIDHLIHVVKGTIARSRASRRNDS